MTLYRHIVFSGVLFTVVFCSWTLASQSGEEIFLRAIKEGKGVSTAELRETISELETRISQLEDQML